MEENIYGQWLKVRFHCRQYNSLNERLSSMDTSTGGQSASPSSPNPLECERVSINLDTGGTISRKSILKNRTLGSDCIRRPEPEVLEEPPDPNLQKVRFLPKRKKNDEPGFYNEQRLSSKSRATSTPDLLVSNTKSGTSCDKANTGEQPAEKPASESASTRIENRYYDVHEYIMEKEDKRIMPIIRLPVAVIILIVILWSFSIFPMRCGLYAIAVVVWITYVQAWNTVVEETLLVISSLGIQVQQTNILGKLKYAKFVPVDNVKAVIVNEIIRRHRVIAYLLIILDSTESTGRIMVPLLIGTLPRLRTIERIYHQIQHAIF